MRECIGLVGQADPVQKLYGLFLSFFLAHQLQIYRGQHNVFLHAQMGEEIKALKHHADVLAHLVDVHLFVGDFVSIHKNLPFGCLFQTVQTPQERGLSAAGRADHADHFALGHRQIDALENIQMVKTLFQIMNDYLFCHSSVSFPYNVPKSSKGM